VEWDRCRSRGRTRHRSRGRTHRTLRTSPAPVGRQDAEDPL